MDEQSQRISRLAFKWLRNELSQEESAELAQWIAEDASNKALFEKLTSETNFHADLRETYAYREKGWKEISEQSGLLLEVQEPAKLRRLPVRWIAAASVIVVIIATYLFLQDVSTDTKAPVLSKADVQAPQSNRATVRLANGQILYLDSVGNGQLAIEGAIQLVKLEDGKIAYLNADGKMIDGELMFNTLSNPNGSKPIDIALADGSHVWLNAGSSVTYPVAFAKNADRKVAITGEAYFEIKKQNGVGFVVQKGATAVSVLGTHFNVKAYDNEPTLKVTLLEGSVNVRTNNRAQKLQPGQQAVVRQTEITLVEEADIEEAVAWKNGKTSFHSADLTTVLREIERWYDLRVVISGAIPAKSFYADVDRSAPLSDILKVLDDNQIHYEFDNQTKTLTIKD